MRRILLLLITLAVVLALAWLVAGLPGQVSGRIGPYEVQAATPVAALALLVLFALAYALLRLLGIIWRSPRIWRRIRANRQRRQGDAAVNRTLVALAAGEGADARREAGRARRLLGDTPHTLLLAAEASRQLGDTAEEAKHYETLAQRADGALLGLRGLLRHAIDRQDWTRAAELARRAEQVHPGAAWLREQRRHLAIRIGNWREAHALAAPNDPSRAALAAAAAGNEPNPDAALRLAKQGFDADPALPQAALEYAARLRAAGKERRAAEALRKSWERNPHPAVAEALLAPLTDKLARVKEAGLLARSNPDHPETHLLLARENLAAGLTGEARRHAETAAKALDQQRAWLLLADIEEAGGGETEAGRQAQREALRHAARAAPDPVWRCGNCGATHAQWHPACPACHVPGQVMWTTSPAAVPVPLGRA